MQPYYLGIDVSKGYADFTMLDKTKRILEPNFQLDDTFEGHNQLYQFLETFFNDHPDAELFAAVESTGGYENNWFHFLHKLQQTFNLRIARLNPKGVNLNNRASLKRVITDKISARSIAEYMIAHPEKISYESEDSLYPIRRKWKFIKSLTKNKTRYLNQLESLLYSANPNILVYCKDGVSQWTLKLLHLFPSAQSLAQATVEAVSAIPYISKDKASTLINDAKMSVASTVDSLTEDTIINLVDEILNFEQKIKQQVKILSEYCSFPELGLLKSFIGIGDFIAIGLLIEIGAIERFATVKHLASFFGLHPVFKESGDGIWGMHMSKQGRAEARALLFMATKVAIQSNPIIQEIYAHNLKKGKSKMSAMGICMHKILRIIYGMLKNKQHFNPDIDRKNRETATKQNTKSRTNKTRRYQQVDRKAPISRRQNKKRKEQEPSQNDNVITYEIQSLAPSP